jgi:hypothetical protein
VRNAIGARYALCRAQRKRHGTGFRRIAGCLLGALGRWFTIVPMVSAKGDIDGSSIVNDQTVGGR